MTRDDIIRMAREAGCGHETVTLEWVCPKNLERFAQLVAAAEREACAEICKKHADVYGAFEPNPSFQAAWAACIDDRDQILARGQQ